MYSFTRHAMKAAKHLLLCSSDIYIAKTIIIDDIKDTVPNGWMDLYSYEPFTTCKSDLCRVVTSLQPYLSKYNNAWHFHLFCRDGFLKCQCDGRRLNDSEEPIDGTNAFDDE